jgi:hypothetical protein
MRPQILSFLPSRVRPFRGSRIVCSACLLVLESLLLSIARGEGPTKNLLSLNDRIEQRLTLQGGQTRVPVRPAGLPT